MSLHLTNMRSFWNFWLEIAFIVGNNYRSIFSIIAGKLIENKYLLGLWGIEINANKLDVGFRIIGGRRAEKAEFPHLVSYIC